MFSDFVEIKTQQTTVKSAKLPNVKRHFTLRSYPNILRPCTIRGTTRAILVVIVPAKLDPAGTEPISRIGEPYPTEHMDENNEGGARIREKEIDEVGEGEKELTSCPAAARERGGGGARGSGGDGRRRRVARSASGRRRRAFSNGARAGFHGYWAPAFALWSPWPRHVLP